MAHTPGPWQTFVAAGGQPAIKQVGDLGKYLFDVSEYPGLGNEANANLHLIAAAPDMLAALKGLITPEEGASPTTARANARAAIAKAEGR